MATEENQNPAENLVEKAEARSEKIEGEIKEKIGKMDNDPETAKEGQAKQAEAEKKG